MPNTKTAKKQLQVSERNRARNVHFSTQLKSAVKQAREAIAADDAEQARAALNNAVKVLYRSVSKGIIKKQNAYRRVSRLMRSYNVRFGETPVIEEPAPVAEEQSAE